MNDDLKTIFDSYDHIKFDIKFLAKSDVRIKILISLREASKNLARLKEDIGLSASTILHGIYQLEKKNLVIRDSGYYSLTPIGDLLSQELMSIIESVSAIKKCKTLLLNHDIRCIPPVLLKDVGCLKDSRIVKSLPTDIMRPHNILRGLLSQSTNVKHLSSVLFTPNIELLFADLEKNRDVHLILTREILDKIMDEVDVKNMEQGLSKGNLKVGLMDDQAKISFTIGDDFIALGLYSTDGNYDLNAYLLSESKEAISWGERLFEHYQDKSINFNDDLIFGS